MPIVVATYAGIVSAEELGAAVDVILHVMKTHGRTRLLADCTQLVGGHSSVDLFYLADRIRESDPSFALREAVLLPVLPDSANGVKFWEDTCFNRGLHVRVFSDRAAALAWLLES